MIERLTKSARFRWNRLRRLAVDKGAPAAWAGFEHLRREGLVEHVKRVGAPRATLETIHAEGVAHNALPANIGSRLDLPDDAGWWGYSFRDVPARTSGPTLLASLRKVQVIPAIDPKGQFWVFLLSADQRALELREMSFRPLHVPVLRRPERRWLPQATWVLERSYHNYSHWLTAHLPKLLLLRERRALGAVYLTEKRPRFVDDSLRLFGFDPAAFPTFDPAVPLLVESLELLSTDRFRPELLWKVREALPGDGEEAGGRRVFISREGADRRRLVNEDALWPMLKERGFERVRMEDLGFAEQVALMRETSVLLAPHGAGLTNMIFCRPGTHVIELADLSFPNPNFYALASAMGLTYWLVAAEPVGDEAPLERDLRVEVASVMAVVDQLPR